MSDPVPAAPPVPAGPTAVSKAVEVLTNPTVRRLLVFVIGMGTTLLHKKLGLELDANDILATVLLVLGYVGQSAYNDASKARSDALMAASLPR